MTRLWLEVTHKIMKTDNKEEAKRFLENRKQWDGSVDHYEKGDFVQRTSDLMAFFHLDMMDKLRFNPETFERVEKPEGWVENVHSYSMIEANLFKHEQWKNALTLDQLIERCKEMRKQIDWDEKHLQVKK